MKTLITPLAVGILSFCFASTGFAAGDSRPPIKVPAPAPRVAPKIPPPDAKSAQVPEGYQAEVLLSGLQYPSSIEFSDTSKIYFGQGTATNSGVVGVDNFLLGWLAPWPEFCDVPGKNIAVTGQLSESADPRFAGDALYVVDIGAVTFTQSGVGPSPGAFPGSGVVWRISRSAEPKTR